MIRDERESFVRAIAVYMYICLYPLSCTAFLMRGFDDEFLRKRSVRSSCAQPALLKNQSLSRTTRDLCAFFIAFFFFHTN